MKTVLLGAAAAAALLACAAPASATTIFQSISDQTIIPASYVCSNCTSNLPNHIYTGEFFTLGSAVTVRSLTVVVAGQSDLVPMTVGIYRTNGDVIDQQLYSHTFTSFIFDHTVYDGLTGFDDAKVVGMNTGGLSLAAGAYVITFANPDQLIVPGYHTGAGHGATDDEGGTEPGIGDLFRGLNGPAGNIDFAVALFDTTITGNGQPGSDVPEPAAWALMVGGFGLAGGMLRRRGAQAPAA
jgi:hypothetical protein